jgi:RNA polymerase sigma-70 factor (ECF subfamily)
MTDSAGPDSPLDEDLVFVRASQAGDLDSFDFLVMKHQPAIAAVLFRFSSQRADLEDLTQETFIRAWRGLPQWQPDRPFIHWLKRIAVNVALEFCRKNRRSPLSRLADDGDRRIAGIVIETTVPANDDARQILSHLPPDQRTLLTLLYLEQMPLGEIAGHLGISLANAKIKAFRARNKLRTILKNHGYSSETDFK